MIPHCYFTSLNGRPLSFLEEQPNLESRFKIELLCSRLFCFNVLHLSHDVVQGTNMFGTSLLHLFVLVSKFGYLKIVKCPLRNVVIKLFHRIPGSITNANQNNGKWIIADHNTKGAVRHLDGLIYMYSVYFSGQISDFYLAATIESTVACSWGLSFSGGKSELLFTYVHNKIFNK